MSKAFTFTADGTEGPFFGPADIILGDSVDMGGGSITVMLDGGSSNFTGKTISGASETKIDSRCSFWLVMAGSSGTYSCDGMVWEGGEKAL